MKSAPLSFIPERKVRDTPSSMTKLGLLPSSPAHWATCLGRVEVSVCVGVVKALRPFSLFWYGTGPTSLVMPSLTASSHRTPRQQCLPPFLRKFWPCVYSPLLRARSHCSLISGFIRFISCSFCR